MPLIAQVFALLAAAIHAWFFVLESILFARPGVAARFGLTTPEAVEAVRPMAFNQGFYNLFLAIVSGIGIAAMFTGHRDVGAALVFAGVGSMAAAAVVLLISARDKARAAVTQGLFPVIAIVLLLIGLLA